MQNTRQQLLKKLLYFYIKNYTQLYYDTILLLLFMHAFLTLLVNFCLYVSHSNMSTAVSTLWYFRSTEKIRNYSRNYRICRTVHFYTNIQLYVRTPCSILFSNQQFLLMLFSLPYYNYRITRMFGCYCFMNDQTSSFPKQPLTNLTLPGEINLSSQVFSPKKNMYSTIRKYHPFR